MEILFTASALLLLAGCALCVWLCVLNRTACAEYEESLRRQIGRIAALEAALAGLEVQHNKLAGRFYRSQPKRDPDTVDLQDGLTDRERLRKEHAERIIPPGVNRGA